MDYRVELDVFNGPLDLLLYLLKRDELDIYDIPIARITESYMQYVTMLRGMKDEAGLDINVARGPVRRSLSRRRQVLHR